MDIGLSRAGGSAAFGCRAYPHTKGLQRADPGCHRAAARNGGAPRFPGAIPHPESGKRNADADPDYRPSEAGSKTSKTDVIHFLLFSSVR